MNGVDYNEVIISGNINVIKDINELSQGDNFITV